MVVPVVLVPVYLGVLHFHLTALLLFVLWPTMHLSIAVLLLHVVRHPYQFLNSTPFVWLGKVSYSLYLWQQLFVYGVAPKPWYSAFFALALASGSYYFVEQPMLRIRENRAEHRKSPVAYADAV